MSDKVHEITRRGTMPDGVKVQVEDWSSVYSFEGFKPYTLAAYARIVNLAALDSFGRYIWATSETMRLTFDFESMEACEAAYFALIGGAATLQDFVEHAGAHDSQNNYIEACGLVRRGV